MPRPDCHLKARELQHLEAIGDFRKEEFNKFNSLSESEKEEKNFRFYK